VMLNQQGFTVVYAHVAQLELEMTPGSLHAVQPANAECPQCHGDGHVPQHGGLRRRPAHGATVAVGSGLRRAGSCEKERAAPREGAALQDHDEGNETTGERSR